jgi:hypothetical protein
MLHLFRIGQSHPESSRKVELREQRFNDRREQSTAQASSVLIDTTRLDREDT